MSEPRDPHAKCIVRTFAQAINILDQTEPVIRDMIESDLMDVAGLNGKVKGAVMSADKLAKKIMLVRARAIKAAFRHLRDNLPSDI